MKKVLFAALILALTGGNVYAYQVDQAVLNTIKNLQIIDYNPSTKIWSRNLGLGHEVFKKHISIGSGSYTEFTCEDKTFELNTTYEFLYYGRLYAYSAHMLKFFELLYDGETINTRELSKEEVQQLFPDVKILLVSEFKDDKIEVTLPIFRRRAFMILNDTDRDFYKYQFEFYNPENKLFNNIFELRMPRTMVFSHFRSKNKLFPKLQVKVKPVRKDTEAENYKEIYGNYVETTPEVQENTPKAQPMDDPGIDDNDF